MKVDLEVVGWRPLPAEQAQEDIRSLFKGGIEDRARCRTDVDLLASWCDIMKRLLVRRRKQVKTRIPHGRE